MTKAHFKVVYWDELLNLPYYINEQTKKQYLHIDLDTANTIKAFAQMKENVKKEIGGV